MDRDYVGSIERRHTVRRGPVGYKCNPLRDRRAEAQEVVYLGTTESACSFFCERSCCLVADPQNGPLTERRAGTKALPSISNKAINPVQTSSTQGAGESKDNCRRPYGLSCRLGFLSSKPTRSGPYVWRSFNRHLKRGASRGRCGADQRPPAPSSIPQTYPTKDT